MLKMRKWKKVMILIMLGIGLSAGIFGLIYKLTVPQKASYDVTLYHYTLQPSLIYKVHLIENEIYDSSVRDEGESYIKNLLDYIQIDFNTNYQASKNSQLDIDYTLIASVIGFVSNDTSRTDFWKKDFPISEHIHKSINSNNIDIKENTNLRLENYEEFAINASRVMGVNLSYELVVCMTGSIMAKTTDGELSAPIDLKIRVPLNNNIITITKEGTEAKADQISTSIEKELPINKMVIGLICAGIVICISSFIVILIIAKEPLEKDLLNNKARKIISNYGSRMVSLKYLPDRKFTQIYILHDIKDLLIVSDEVHMPIYYIADDFDIVKDYTFYCENHENLYMYRIEDSSSYDEDSILADNTGQHDKEEAS